MKGAFAVFVALCFVSGCASPQGGAVIESRARPQANLALGGGADTARLAVAWTGRGDWPATEIGQRTDEMTFYTTVTSDEQYNYDRHGGLFRGAQTVKTGVWLR